ncbi:MAG: PAS domain-containing sensor histidine kinase [Bacteroidota bacterium]
MHLFSKADIFASSSPEVLDSLPLPTLLVDPSGRIEYANALICKLLDEEAGHLVGRSFLQGPWLLIYPDNTAIESAQELLDDLPQTRETIQGKKIGLIFKTGTLWLALYAQPQFSEADEYLGVIITLMDVTASTEKELKFSHQSERLRSVPEHQTNYIIRTDLDGNFLYLNQAALAQFDQGEEEDVFRSLNYLTDPIYAIRCIKAAAYCIEHPGSHRHIEIRCYNKDREYFWTAWELVGVTNEAGEVIEIQAVGHDISKKKRMADLLGETSQMARIGGWEISNFSQKVSWTPETYRIHDLPEGTPISLRKAIEFFNPEYQPVLRKAYRKLITKGESFDLRLKMLTALKREVWVRVIGQQESVHGNFVRAYGVMQDITEIQRSKEKIKHREWLFQSVFNSTADALFIIDESYKIIDCNQNALRMIEVEDKDAVLGADATSFQKEPYQEDTIATIRKTIDEAGVWTDELEFVSTQAKLFWGSLAITTFPKMGYGVVRVTDITDKKKAESLLLESNENLIKANKELDRFVYSVSHDIRAPLTSILGLISLTEMESMSDQVRDYLKHMEKSAHRLDDFIKDLTYFSRNARLKVTSEPIEFEKLITELFEQYQFMDYQAPVKTYLDISQSCTFHSDKSRLQIVLGNIISNAMKYHLGREDTESYVKVKIEIDEKEAVVLIEDNGTGIANEHQDKIFDMFYRADDHKPGSGLGLYIVKETVDKLQGSVKLHSEQDRGTTFTLHLPQLTPDS